MAIQMCSQTPFLDSDCSLKLATTWTVEETLSTSFKSFFNSNSYYTTAKVICKMGLFYLNYFCVSMCTLHQNRYCFSCCFECLWPCHLISPSHLNSFKHFWFTSSFDQQMGECLIFWYFEVDKFSSINRKSPLSVLYLFFPQLFELTFCLYLRYLNLAIQSMQAFFSYL